MSEPTDAVLEAMAALEAVLEANTRRSQAMRERIGEIRALRLAGHSYREIVSAEQPPLIVELLTDSAQGLDRAGAEVRRTEARALHREGLTMDEIAELFGVTRQRISALLRAATAGA
jgi:predicted transcriptional regulator